MTPSPPLRGEREGPAKREGEVGDAANRLVGPLTLPSPPASGGEEKISVVKPTPGEYRALLWRDLVSFAQRCFRELNPKARFEPEPSAQILCVTPWTPFSR